MSGIEITTTIKLPSTHQNDKLIECILFLRNIARTYPEHIDIAYEALQREANLPQHQIPEFKP